MFIPVRTCTSTPMPHFVAFSSAFHFHCASLDLRNCVVLGSSLKFFFLTGRYEFCFQLLHAINTCPFFLS